jgi:phospho-N-acetylmuramoyl-pentapeptide-transferase
MRSAGAGQPIRDYGPKIHEHKRGTPTMGGVVPLAVYFAVLIIYQLYSPLGPVGLVPASALLGFGLVGFLDDALKFLQQHARGLPARYKLLGQLLVIAGLVALMRALGLGEELTPLRVPFREEGWALEGWALYGLIALTFLGTVNAWNLTDGLDGLAAGITLLVLVGLGTLAPAEGAVGNLPGLIAIFAAGLLGFLWWNVHPARIFLGDTGSMALGGFVAAVSVVTGTELFLLLFAIVPVLEALSVIVQVTSFKLFGRRIFKVSPFHHHFERAEGIDYPYLLPSVELPEWAITLMFWGLTALGVALGLWGSF